MKKQALKTGWQKDHYIKVYYKPKFLYSAYEC